jgi:hypothetical protein
MTNDDGICLISQRYFFFYSTYTENDSKEHRDIVRTIIITLNT